MEAGTLAEEADQNINSHFEEKTSVKKERITLQRIVRVFAVVTCALLIAFCVVVISNISVINGQVEYIAESQFPISVAAGHMETDIVHMQSIIEAEAYHQLGSDSSRMAEKNTFEEILNDMDTQIEIIERSKRTEDIRISPIGNLMGLLRSRTTTFFQMSQGGDGTRNSYDDISSYADLYIQPILTLMLDLDSEIIETTNAKTNAMNRDVRSSASVLLTFSIIMAAATLATCIIMMASLRVMNRLEKNLRENLTYALRQMDEANQAKSTFMANMSHDIRTPMNAIFGLTQIAIESIDDKLRVQQCLVRITTSSQHLLSLINDVLDMNKIESGKVVLSHEAFSLSGLAEEIETLFQSQSETRKRQCEVIVENLFADLLMGDAMRLRQILLNLASNALKYTNEGDLVRLKVIERATANPAIANVTFIVEDTGIGMQPEFIKRIFEPFERENNDFTNFTEGTGLGMAITKNLIDLMGGRIKVESDLGIGTTVTIKLNFPIADKIVIDEPAEGLPEADQAEEEAEIIIEASPSPAKDHGDAESAQVSQGAEVQEAQPASANSEKVSSGKTDEAAFGKPAVKKKKLKVSGNVLIVEDNEINMEIAHQLISSRGAQVEEAYDGLEAVSKITTSPDGTYDLIFMDWQMPHMNGIEATKSIRRFLEERGRDQIPIVAMTANAFASDRKQAIDSGMNDFMSKPIDIFQLEEVLKTYLKEE